MKKQTEIEVIKFELMILQHRLISAMFGCKDIACKRDRWQRLAERLNCECNKLRVRAGLKHRTLVPRLVSLGKASPFL